MNISFYNGFTAMVAQQEGLNIYSNNIANVNTVGFKAERPSFADCIYTLQRPETEADWETGHGQYVMKTDFLWDEGGFTVTDQPLDFALPNDGFFMVTDRRGDNYLTRSGAFNMSESPEGVWELVNESGDYVLDYEGNHIPIPYLKEIVKTEVKGEATPVMVNAADPVTGLPLYNEDGTIQQVQALDPRTGEPAVLPGISTWTEEEVDTQLVDYDALQEAIGVYTVPNNWGLEQADSNHLVATDRSGQPVANDTYDKIRQALEMSTTDLATDMVHIIETQRGYQLAAKIVQTSDEFIRIANNLRG
ncbi:flagellar basal-body rod protein FlgG [Clostridia bacterium]|nr:flagellar basal-body rod protein FlgG [Clostridia bacterium]